MSDQYEHYNYDEKLHHSRGSGKNRTKTEAEQHKVTEENTRKIVNNLKNNEQNKNEKRLTDLKH